MIAITNTIPDILKQLVQWVCWILMPDPKGGKPKKVPINPRTGKAAKPNDPSTWTDYQTAVSAAGKYGYSGIGFMLAEDDGFVVVDIDHCYDPQTKSYNDVAKAIMGRQDTYAELSPSGDGVHLWYLGAKPGKASKNTETGVEMYDCGRYLTVTGDILPGATPDIQQAKPDTLTWIHTTYVAKVAPKKKKAKRNYLVDKLTDEEILEKAKNAQNGVEFAALMDGNWQGKYASQSEADLALCKMLAFWCAKDTDQMARIFRQSGLFRGKWDEVHSAGGETYGSQTLEKAVDSTQDVYSPWKKPQFLRRTVFICGKKRIRSTRSPTLSSGQWR